MPHLKAGDTIAVLALSSSMHGCNEEVRGYAERRLTQEFGLNVVYGTNARATGPRNVVPVGLRVDDLHNAFADPNIAAIIMFRGGYHLNDILPYVDWDLVRQNWKPFIGYSDATAFQLALYARTSLMSFSGPMFTNFGELKLFEYSMEYFRGCLFEDGPYRIEASEEWHDDPWPANQDDRMPIPNPGPFNESGNTTLQMFVRRLEALTQRPDFSGVRAVVIGRFQKLGVKDIHTCVFDEELIACIREREDVFRGRIVIANANTGHAAPYATYPIGGIVRVASVQGKPVIEVLEHDRGQ